MDLDLVYVDMIQQQNHDTVHTHLNWTFKDYLQRNLQNITEW